MVDERFDRVDGLGAAALSGLVVGTRAVAVRSLTTARKGDLS